MAHGYTVAYLDWAANRLWNDADRPDEFEVFLFNDDEDEPDLLVESDLGWLETEPDGLGRATFEFGEVGTEEDNGRVFAQFGDAEFDLDGVEGTVDSLGIAFEYDGDDLFVGTGPLEEEIDLGDYTDPSWAVDAGAALYSMF